jgi:hypothetical protein
MKRTSTLILFLALATFSVSGQAPTQWLEVGRTNEFVYLIRSSQLFDRHGALAEVWIKVVPVDLAKYRRGIRARRAAAKLPYGEYQRYAYSLTQMQIRCGGEETRVMDVVDYDSSGSTIPNRKDLYPADWEANVPDSVGETLAWNVCHGLAI